MGISDRIDRWRGRLEHKFGGPEYRYTLPDGTTTTDEATFRQAWSDHHQQRDMEKQLREGERAVRQAGR